MQKMGIKSYMRLLEIKVFYTFFRDDPIPDYSKGTHSVPINQRI